MHAFNGRSFERSKYRVRLFSLGERRKNNNEREIIIRDTKPDIYGILHAYIQKKKQTGKMNVILAILIFSMLYRYKEMNAINFH